MKDLVNKTDCWTFNGKVMVKDLVNMANEITSDDDLRLY